MIKSNSLCCLITNSIHTYFCSWNNDETTDEIEGEPANNKAMQVFTFMSDLKGYLLQGKHCLCCGDKIMAFPGWTTAESDERLNQAIADNMVRLYRADGDNSLTQLKHIITWMRVNTPHLSIYMQFIVLRDNEEVICSGDLTHHEVVLLDSISSEEVDQLTLHATSGQDQWLTIAGTNNYQKQIPVIQQVSKQVGGGVFKIQNYNLSHYEENDVWMLQ